VVALPAPPLGLLLGGPDGCLVVQLHALLGQPLLFGVDDLL
jgi:hypothetical protein